MADISLIENKIGLLVWKTSNYWQSNLRKILNPFNISLSEYLILKSINNLQINNENIYQNQIANLIGFDISVTSVTLKLLEKKKYIIKHSDKDIRKKIVVITEEGKLIFEKIDPLIDNVEEKIFSKLNNEIFNFKNSLKLLLGKKIRIKADKI